MKNQTFAGGTLFHLYLSTLKSLKYKKAGIETLLVYNDKTPNIDVLIAALKKYHIFNYFLSVPTVEISVKRNSTESNFKRRFGKNKLDIKYVEENSEINKYKNFIENSEINLFYNIGLLSSYFITKYKKVYIRQIEDGYRNYNHKVSKFKAFKRKYLANTFIGEGIDKEVKSIEVQFPEKLPKSTRYKGKKLDLKQLQNNLTREEKEIILTIFLGDNVININCGKNLLLITQPLSEDNIVSEEKKISLYQQVLDKYAEDYNIYIKTHPREKTDYKSVLKTDFNEISRDFPIELFNFFDNIKFNLGITVFSSAIYNIDCIESIIFLGKEYISNN